MRVLFFPTCYNRLWQFRLFHWKFLFIALSVSASLAANIVFCLVDRMIDWMVLGWVNQHPLASIVFKYNQSIDRCGVVDWIERLLMLQVHGSNPTPSLKNISSLPRCQEVLRTYHFHLGCTWRLCISFLSKCCGVKEQETIPFPWSF